CLARSLVGRTSVPGGASSFRPLAVPPITRTAATLATALPSPSMLGARRARRTLAAVKGLGVCWHPLEAAEATGRPSGTLVATFEPDPSWEGVPGYLHGGMAAAVLDECLGALSHALDDLPTMTGTLDLRFRRPVPLDGSTMRV